MSGSPAEKNKSLQLCEECRIGVFSQCLLVICSVFMWALKTTSYNVLKNIPAF